MTTLHDADKVMAGSVPAVAVYAGAVKVWPSGPPMPASASVNVLSFSLSPDDPVGVPQGQAPSTPNTFADGATLYAYYQTTGPFAQRTWERWTWPLQVCWYGGQPVQAPSGWGFTAPPCPTPGTPTQIRIGHPAGAPLPGQDPPWEDPDGNTFATTITTT